MITVANYLFLWSNSQRNFSIFQGGTQSFPGTNRGTGLCLPVLYYLEGAGSISEYNIANGQFLSRKSRTEDHQ